MSNKYADKSKALERREQLNARKRRTAATNVTHNMRYIKMSHSKGAEAAYKEHKRPYDKWELKHFRRELWRILSEEGYDITDIYMLKNRMSYIGKRQLRKMLLKSSHEKHHIGDFYELTSFFEVDKEKLLGFVNSEFEKDRKVIAEIADKNTN